MRFVYAILAVVGLLFGGLLFLRFSGSLQTWKLPTGGMQPTLSPGDCIFSENVAYRFRKPRRGEIVVFSTDGLTGIPSDPSQPAPIYIQRLIGLPGDELELRNGALLVNGKDDPAL